MHWLTFDEPQSRLKKALKRSNFFRDLLHSKIESTPLAPEEKAIRLAALAFALEDITRFQSVCFNSIAATLSSIKPHPENFYTAILERIHAGLSTALRRQNNLTPQELVWAALCSEYIAEACLGLSEQKRSSQENKGDPLDLLSNVAEKIAAETADAHATECSAIMSVAAAQFTLCFQNAKCALEPEFLPEKLLLVEGQTEAILLPLFAEISGLEFLKNRILMISGGGANQVAKRFLSFRQASKLPIACLLDGDARTQYDVIRQHLDDCDMLFSLAAGEFEDTFELPVFIRLLNAYLQSMTGVNAPSLVEYQPLTEAHFEPGQKRTQILNKIWRSKSLGNFDKVEFAAFVAQNIRTGKDIPEDFKLLIAELKGRWGN